jgi:hypothetical protein
MNAACGWTLIRKTSLLRKINPMMRRSSFTNKEHLQLPHLEMSERRNVPGDSDWHQRIASQIPNSDQSPLYDVRNPAGASRVGQRMRSDVSRTMFLAMVVGTDSPSSLYRATPGTLHFALAWLRHAQPKAKRGGARRDRTDDLMLAKHALSQLSYGPVPEDECRHAEP